jgi:hypothetical protein
MMIASAILVGLVLYTGLFFAISVLAAHCLSATHGTEAGERLKNSIVTMKPSRFMPNVYGDGHPMDPRTWFALRHARDLPEAVQRKARTIGRLYDAEKLVLAASVVAILVVCVVGR